MKRSIQLHRGLAACLVFVLLLALGTSVLAQEPVRIIFLHHSCGHNLIEEGGVREGFAARGYEFYDHGYNGDGLRLADGTYTGTNFDVPGDNTDPDGFAEIFAQPLHDPPDNAFSHLMQYDVIAFKSCYPTSNIGSDDQLNEFKGYYLTARDTMDQYPDKVFIVVTQPPQVPGESNAAEGTRARALADWLKSDEYLAGHPNVFTFDFFDLLAGSDNLLRSEYRYDDYDGHPNAQANAATGPQFVNFVDQAVRGYQGGGPRPEPVVAPEPAEETTQPPPPVIAPLPTAGVIDDFEMASDFWQDAEQGSTVECGLDAGTAHGGVSSLRLDYNVVGSEGWGDCGRDFGGPQDWSAATGLALWLRLDGEPEWMTLMLFSGDPESATPFEVDFESASGSAGDWTQFVFSWADFAKAEWVGDEGIAEIDPSRMIGYGISIGTGQGTAWVDDVALVTGEPPPPGPAPTTAPVAPGEEPGEGEGTGGGICSSAMALPLGMLGVLLVVRRRRW
jgi:hypothetical protein